MLGRGTGEKEGGLDQGDLSTSSLQLPGPRQCQTLGARPLVAGRGVRPQVVLGDSAFP